MVMQTIIEAMREVLGSPHVYIDGVLDYGLLAEYIGGVTLLCIIVFSIFKIVVRAFGSK